MVDKLEFLDSRGNVVGGVDEDGKETVRVIVKDEEGNILTDTVLPIEEAKKLRDGTLDNDPEGEVPSGDR